MSQIFLKTFRLTPKKVYRSSRAKCSKSEINGSARSEPRSPGTRGDGATCKLINNFSDIFALDAHELGTTKLVQHAIKTGNHSPIRQQLQRMPFSLRSDVDRMVGEMLSQGVIQPYSSPWASPVVLVKKIWRNKILCRLSSSQSHHQVRRISPSSNR